MNDGTKRVGTQIFVPGDIWLMGKESQDREWDQVRRSYDEFLAENDLTSVGEPRETTEFDEKRGVVILRREGRVR